MPRAINRLRFAKPEPRQRTKGRARRQESAVARTVREACVMRDGHCRITRDLLSPFRYAGCAGPSEWAHLGDARRFKTRGQAPERRHTTAGSLMLCREAHQAYDAGKLRIEPLTDRGADGRLRFTRGAAVYEETAEGC